MLEVRSPWDLKIIQKIKCHGENEIEKMRGTPLYDMLIEKAKAAKEFKKDPEKYVRQNTEVIKRFKFNNCFCLFFIIVYPLLVV